jgi:(4S)-4-hydroxy-5-phosphonooxypentane-2,3-dione isomerase
MSRVTFLSRMTVKAGREADYERLVKRLTEITLKTEPDCIYYEFFRLREPRRYAVLESFKSEAAEHQHLDSAAFKEIAPGILDCLDGTYVREYLDAF